MLLPSPVVTIRVLNHVLVVEDDRPLLNAMEQALKARGARRVAKASTVAQALRCLDDKPSLVLLDVRLPDGSALDVVDKAHRVRPLPSVVAMSGLATPKEAFELAVAGVRAFLVKPLGMNDLDAALESLVHEPPKLSTAVAASVGHAALPALLQLVRSSMLDQAMALAEGSQSGAARLLRISRQAVQQAVRGTSPDRDAS